MESTLDYFKDSWSTYWHPPSAEQVLRRARVRISNKTNQLDMKLKVLEHEEDQAMRKLMTAAQTADEVVLRRLAREVARKKGLANKTREARRLMTAAEGRMVVAESSTAIRDAMRSTTAALGVAVDGGPAGWNNEMQEMLQNVHAAETMEHAMDDAMGDENEEFDTDEVVGELMAKAHDALINNLPRPPDNPPMIHAADPMRGLEMKDDE